MGSTIVTTVMDVLGDQLQASLHLMQRHMVHFHTHPLFVRMAREIVAKANATTRQQEAEAIWAWVKARVKYRHDPAGAEWIQDPVATVTQNAGDCDDMATLAGTLLMAIGHPSIPTAVWWKGRTGYSHAVIYDGLTMQVVDPVSPTPPTSWPPQGWQVERMTGPSPRWPLKTVPSLAPQHVTMQGWSINKLKKALKRVHQSITRVLPKPLRKLDAKITGTLDRFDTSVSKDFAKAKHWSQEHRKTLQIVAAAAVTLGVAAYVGGGYGALWTAVKAKAGAALSALGSSGVLKSAAAILIPQLLKKQQEEGLTADEQKVLAEAQAAQAGQTAGLIEGGQGGQMGPFQEGGEGGGGGEPSGDGGGMLSGNMPWIIGGGVVLLLLMSGGGSSSKEARA